MSEIKLKKHNKKKYCPFCRTIVEVEMKGGNGYCPVCEMKLYTIDTRVK